MRRPAGVPGRLVITDLHGATTTWLHRRSLLEATVTANLNLPWQITASVRSGDAAVNTIFATDGDPHVAQSNRLVYMFLREAPPLMNPWICRASGILMSPQDQADADTSTTHFTAYDPWQYMMGLPCFIDQVGTYPGPGGFLFTAAGNVIAYTLIQNTITSLLALGFPLATSGVFADIPNAYGGSIHWTGTNETTPLLNFRLQQGVSLGQALQQLCTAGSSVEGTSQCIDIVFEPIYDPANRPGYCSQISVFDLAGVERPSAPMAWARFNRSAVTADRQHDGTPGAFTNVAQYVPGQGTPLLPSQIVENASSVAKYYPYWEQRWFPGQPFATVTMNLAVQAVQLRKQGKRTYLVDPDPLRAGMPFRDYAPGDRVPVYSTKGQRTGDAGYERVETLPVVIGPDGVTAVKQLLVSPDWPQDEGGGGGGGSGGSGGEGGGGLGCVPFLPLSPVGYSVPGGAVPVTDGATLAAVVGPPIDIVLADGVYTGAALAIGRSRLWSANLLGAELHFGVQTNQPGAALRGLGFNVSDPALTLGSACAQFWGAGAGASVQDCVFHANNALLYGVLCYAPDGFVLRRVEGDNCLGVGYRLSDNNSSSSAEIAAISDVYWDVASSGGSSGGTSEVCLWVGHPCAGAIERLHLIGGFTAGLETVNQCNNNTFGDITVSSPGTVGVYLEHYTRYNLFRCYAISGARTGFNAEYDDGVPGNAASHFNEFVGGTITSTVAGIYLDAGSESSTIENTVFVGQSWAAIGAFMNIGANVYSGNDYTGIGGGAVPVSTDHIP